MIKKLFFLFFVFLNFYSISLANTNICNEFKKFSVEYLKCKGNIIKDKTISTGQNIIKDTKDYQNKEWSKEKGKIDKIKKEINKARDKVLNQ